MLAALCYIGAARHLLCTGALKDPSGAAVLGITVACDAGGQNMEAQPCSFQHGVMLAWSCTTSPNTRSLKPSLGRHCSGRFGNKYSLELLGKVLAERDAGPCQYPSLPGQRFEPGHGTDDDLADELIIGFEEGVA